eukprot:TRINITY_DN20363_c0_g1_i1.p1 TRINITY_DN20363_c0_g1~~TRINITY_DN20363_c0_g1_i1.p1  ORF type:complete len:303 (-),score=63.29 TRINITY_DN20363_c0_g1_i1:260-1168(-)
MAMALLRKVGIPSALCFTAFVVMGCEEAPELRASTAADQKVAEAVNSMYKKTDTGLNMHLVDQTEDTNSPWLACLEKNDQCDWQPLGRLSFSILNQLAFNEAQQQITAFGTMNAPGYIATDTVTQSGLSCIFPGDGGTMERSHVGCGCMLKTHADSCDPNQYNWCPEDATPWDGICAMHPDMMPEMLKQFKARGFPYNEVVVDGQKWNADISNNIWAFVVPVGGKGSCGEDTDCYSNFVTWYNTFEGQNGRHTILGLDVTNKDAPFSPFPPIQQNETETDNATMPSFTTITTTDNATATFIL